MDKYVVRCRSPEEFRQLKTEFGDAVKSENEKRNVLSIETEILISNTLKARGLIVYLEAKFNPEFVN